MARGVKHNPFEPVEIDGRMWVVAEPEDEYLLEVEVPPDGPEPPSPTMVYFIRCGEFVKIGIARDLKRRLMALANANPYPLTVAHTIEMPTWSAAIRLERKLHREFQHAHHVREWFRWDGAIQARCECPTITAS